MKNLLPELTVSHELIMSAPHPTAMQKGKPYLVVEDVFDEGLREGFLVDQVLPQSLCQSRGLALITKQGRTKQCNGT